MLNNFKYIKYFLSILTILFFLYPNACKAFDGEVAPSNYDITIVRDKDKIEKYKKLFVHFMPEKFKIAEDGKIDMIDKSGIYQKYTEGNVLVAFAESEYKSDLNFRLIFVWVFYTKENEGKGVTGYKPTYVYENMYVSYKDKRFYIETYYPGDSLYCFLGISTNKQCMDRSTFYGRKELALGDLERYWKNVNKK